MIIVNITTVEGKSWVIRVKGNYRWAGRDNDMYKVITDADTYEFNLDHVLHVQLGFDYSVKGTGISQD